jgi:O-acetyl-ADP-ribose deacetylase (regulator of RNase III)
MLIEKDGDLLESDAQYIVHQCNCVSSSSAGIAKFIFNKYPDSNIYKTRTEPSTPGTIQVCEGERGIINLFGQYYPGSSSFDNDSKELRISWFKECLNEIYRMRDKIKSIAFPHGIGCGLAGGDWELYKQFIKKLAEHMPNTEVYIIRKL